VASTDSICDNEGQPFTNRSDRNEYVRNFYSTLYKKPDTDDNNIFGCIERFLGPEIVNSAIVRDSKIPAEVSR